MTLRERLRIFLRREKNAPLAQQVEPETEADPDGKHMPNPPETRHISRAPETRHITGPDDTKDDRSRTGQK